MTRFADWLSRRPAREIDQDCYRYERALREVLRLTDCAIARGLAAAALSRDRDEQHQLERRLERQPDWHPV
jgi:hypothetical protein